MIYVNFGILEFHMKKIILSAILVFSFSLGSFAQAASPTLKSQFDGLITKNKLTASKQSMCITDESGTITTEKNMNLRIVPASVSKIYTTDWALSELPADFRYTTEFILNGKTLYINGGGLPAQAGDPHFVIEHLDKVLNEIYDEKHIKVSKIVFSPNFYFNWRKNPEDIQKSILASIAERTELPVSKTLTVAYATTPYSGRGTKFEFKSAPLLALLKQMNDYSTNISAEVLFNKLGGVPAFEKYMQETYSVGNETITFANGSGMPGNYTTCALTLRVLRNLNETLAEKDLALTDVLSAPAADLGVLIKRGFDLNLANAMVAKSGFVFNHSTLAGAIQTKDGIRYFGIFTNYPNLAKTESVKYMVDTFTNTLLKSFQQNLKPFDYISDPTALEDIKISKK